MDPVTRFEQQKGIVDPAILKDKHFLIVGAGAIGSFFTMTLAKMGAQHIIVYDDDKIEDHNFANQMYPAHTIGDHKVMALRAVTQEYAEVTIDDVNGRFNDKTAVYADIVVSAVDNMDVRKIIYEATKKAGKLFIDGRMGGQVMRVYTINTANPDECAFYERSLYTQAKAAPERCTEKTVIFTVLLVSGLMLDAVKKLIMGQKYAQEIVYDVVNNILIPTTLRPPVVVDAADVPEPVGLVE